jgi:hypothetical protein
MIPARRGTVVLVAPVRERFSRAGGMGVEDAAAIRQQEDK